MPTRQSNQWDRIPAILSRLSLVLRLSRPSFYICLKDASSSSNGEIRPEARRFVCNSNPLKSPTLYHGLSTPYRISMVGITWQKEHITDSAIIPPKEQLFGTMKTFTVAFLSWLSCGAYAAYDPFKMITLTAPDNSVKMGVLPFGAIVTEFWTKDKYGKFRDVALGFDDKTLYSNGPDHPYFGAIIGRYANRIKNATFSIPITANPDPNSNAPGIYHVPKNINGELFLHGGTIGWDRANWTIVSQTASSISLGHVDPDGNNGFPGTVSANLTYTLKAGGIWTTEIKAKATKLTPILLTSHAYWNLDAFQDTDDVLDHWLQINSNKVVAVDGDGYPTGNLWNVAGTPLDFRTPYQVGSRITDAVGGPPGSAGYDYGWLYSSSNPGVTFWSASSGIKLQIKSNQPTAQLYTCQGFNIPRKAVHGGPTKVYGTRACAALEQQSWVDGIHHPEWPVDQIYGPNRDYLWTSEYKFSTIY